ncbi:MAG: hypothetical protein BroJett018_15950 [Chloroflexota bacterium]|nr:hypothetical protein [Chloroflexota bacterium]NOG65719.1 hypothetical protein [Chloroflexota bacterium]GIK63801.1 MAG: hypothetical protein BroJett018_15950 [Chloroflexota bacterium]
MDSILAAFFVMFLMVFGVLTLTDEFVNTQTTVQEAWQVMDERRDDQVGTQLVGLEAHTNDNGALILLTLRNTGMVKLSDFARWDVFIQYMDDVEPSGYHIDHLPYTPNDPTIEGWLINEITLDDGQPEAFDLNILNPGESATMRLRLVPPIGPGRAAMIRIAMPNGVSTSYTFARSALPVLDTNSGMILASAGTATLSNAILAASDPDNEAMDLIYAVTLPPVQGNLNLSAFTQDDINQNRVTYTHTGSGHDDFQVTLTDGENVVGPFIVSITINEPPKVVSNGGMTLSTGTSAPITTLATSDPDTPLAELIYTVTTLPSQGTLSHMTFSQADLDGGLVIYTNVGGSSDSFQFSVTDGVTTLDPLTFNITVN